MLATAISECIRYLMIFFESHFFIIVSNASTIIMLATLLYAFYLWLSGVWPVLYRLGMALSKKKVAIFASTEFDSLRSMLVDSQMFKNKNITQINKNDIKKSAKAHLFLVHWKDYQESINEIIDLKNDSTALVIYAPQNEGKIENQEALTKINSERNSLIVNFRGRLLNDVFISLLTTK